MLDPLEMFGLRTRRVLPGIALCGSPQRCAARSVREDRQGRQWILEQLRGDQVDRRRAVAGILERLRGMGLERLPEIRRSVDQEHVARCAGMHWQLTRYVPSDPLPRPGYLDHAERGVELAAFLTDFSPACRNLPLKAADPLGPALDPLAYARDLEETVRRARPRVHSRFSTVLRGLKPHGDALSALPVSWQHGDFHPLNVLWRGRKAVAVIDWEFLGLRPECWDVGNMLGCLGFEHPSGLVGPLAAGLVQGVARAGILSAASWAVLPEFMVLQRSAWLAEWLRQGDGDLVDMELDYMEWLLREADHLRSVWNSAVPEGEAA